MAGTLHKNQYTFFIMSCSVHLKMRNVSTKFVEKIQIHILCSIIFFSENHVLYDKMWKNIVEPDRSQMKIWRMRFACCMLQATNTHSQYAILIAFPRQQCLYESASVLRSYAHCLSGWTYLKQKLTAFEWRKSFQCLYDTPVIPNPFSMKESPEWFFISRGTPTYGKVHMPEKADSGKRNSITAKFLSLKLVLNSRY